MTNHLIAYAMAAARALVAAAERDAAGAGLVAAMTAAAQPFARAHGVEAIS